MRNLAVMAALAAVALVAPAGAATIEKACLGSGRAAADRGLCACIQQVADATLSASDQKRAAKFFDDPDAAQKIRVSDSKSHEAFWLRYKAFGATAEAYCR